MPHPDRGGHYKLSAVFRPSACLSLCRTPRLNSRTERVKELKIGTMEVNHMINQTSYLKVKRSKVKVT